MKETYTYKICIQGDKVLDKAFRNDPKGLLEWLREHEQIQYEGDHSYSPEGASAKDVSVTAPLDDWIEAGAGITTRGGITQVDRRSDDGSLRSIQSMLLDALEKEVVRTGLVPNELSSEITTGVLQARARKLSEAEEKKKQIKEEAARKKAEKIAEQEAYEVERLQWAADHGSARLRKAIDLGLLDECNGVYRDERLAKDFPDWRWEKESDYFKDIRNPSLKAMQTLESVRCELGEAYLWWLRDNEGFEGPVICAEILGKQALRWADDG